jgi:hypothetical protein
MFLLLKSRFSDNIKKYLRVNWVKGYREIWML